MTATATAAPATPVRAAPPAIAPAVVAASLAPTENGIALREYLKPHLAAIKITTDAAFAAAVDQGENVIASWYRTGNLSRKNAKHVASLIARPVDELLRAIGRAEEAPAESSPTPPSQRPVAERKAAPTVKKGSRKARAQTAANAGEAGPSLLTAVYAAKTWFLSLNVDGLPLSQHLRNPTAHCRTKSEESLALAVAAWIDAGG